MAKGITCANCCYLDKTEKVQTGVMYKYGCRSHHAYMGHITGWLSSDSGLKQMGCSESNKLCFGTVFGVRKTEKNLSCRYIYLGTVGKHFKKRCLYNLIWKQKECVDDDWIEGKNILIYDYHNLYVVYQHKNSYGLTGVENLLRMETKESKTMIREGIITVLRADGIEQARKLQKKAIERWEEKNILPFN